MWRITKATIQAWKKGIFTKGIGKNKEKCNKNVGILLFTCYFSCVRIKKKIELYKNKQKEKENNENECNHQACP